MKHLNSNHNKQPKYSTPGGNLLQNRTKSKKATPKKKLKLVKLSCILLDNTLFASFRIPKQIHKQITGTFFDIYSIGFPLLTGQSGSSIQKGRFLPGNKSFNLSLTNFIFLFLINFQEPIRLYQKSFHPPQGLHSNHSQNTYKV